jgi:hypothetical protein
LNKDSNQNVVGPRKRHSRKKRMEYREVIFKDGSVFKGMIKSLAGTGMTLNKKKLISGTGEFTFASDNTIYKGSLVKG